MSYSYFNYKSLIKKCRDAARELHELADSLERGFNHLDRQMVITLSEGDMAIYNLNLSIRSGNALDSIGIVTVKGLIDYAAKNDIRSIRNLGANSEKEIREALRKHGYQLPSSRAG